MNHLELALKNNEVAINEIDNRYPPKFRASFRIKVAAANRLHYFAVVTSAIIEEIKDLPPNEQVKVIQYAFELARTRQLTAEELGILAKRLAQSEDPAEIVRLKSAMTRGFYGE